MARVKTAIAVPEDVLADIDRAARACGESRSKYITRVLQAAVRARRDADVTRRLDELFAREDVATARRTATPAFDEVGASWTDDRW
jgi:hypothetical protein